MAIIDYGEGRCDRTLGAFVAGEISHTEAASDPKPAVYGAIV